MTGEPRRREIPEVPYDALREAIINAVAHRDYFEKGANVMIEMFDDRIEITNPGGLVKGLRPEDFGKKSVLRNPNIANLLHRAGYIEKMGTGINKMRGLVADAGLPPIDFEFGTFFTATFRRPERLQRDVENVGVKGKRLPRILKVLEIIGRGEPLSDTYLAETFRVTERTIERDLSLLKQKGVIEFIGSPKTGHYVLTENGKRLIKG